MSAIYLLIAQAPARAGRCTGLPLTLPPGLPSPLSVNVEAEEEILKFINKVTPLSSPATPMALENGFKRFWARYRPDLTEAEINARMMPTRPSILALAYLKQKAIDEKRIEVGKLRLTWMAFIKDIAPDEAKFEPVVVHRAEVLAVEQKYTSVLAYLKDSFDPRMNLADQWFGLVMRKLFETYALEAKIPTLRLTATATYDRGRQVLKIWNAYVAALTAKRGVKINPKTLWHIKYDLDPKADPSTVPDDPKAMLEFLVLRYPEIKRGSRRAILRYIKALRDEWDLGPTLIDIAPSAAVGIVHGESIFPGEQLRLIWQEFLEHRAAKLATAPSASKSDD